MEDIDIAAYAYTSVYTYARGEPGNMPTTAGALEALKADMRATKANSGIGWRLDTLRKMRRAVRTICGRFGFDAMGAMRN
jgi:hypothetical protein